MDSVEYPALPLAPDPQGTNALGEEPGQNASERRPSAAASPPQAPKGDFPALRSDVTSDPALRVCDPAPPGAARAWAHVSRGRTSTEAPLPAVGRPGPGCSAQSRCLPALRPARGKTVARR